MRTQRKGDFPAECVYVLPTITKPPPEILVSFCSILIEWIPSWMDLNQFLVIYEKTAIRLRKVDGSLSPGLPYITVEWCRAHDLKSLDPSPGLV